MNVELGLFGMVLNQFITAPEFFHWLILVASTVSLLIRSNMCLEMMPISLLAGLINLQVGWLLKFSLWSLSVTYAGFSASTSILSDRSRVGDRFDSVR